MTASKCRRCLYDNLTLHLCLDLFHFLVPSHSILLLLLLPLPLFLFLLLPHTLNGVEVRQKGRRRVDLSLQSPDGPRGRLLE